MPERTTGSKGAQIKLGCAAPHLRLTENLQTVLTDELQQLAVRQAEELLLFGYLGHADKSVHKCSLRSGDENEDCTRQQKETRALGGVGDATPLTSLKCVLMYSRHQQCSSQQPISSAKRAMPMTLAGSTCLVRKSQHALATSSTWNLWEDRRSVRGSGTHPAGPRPQRGLPHSSQEEVQHALLPHCNAGCVGKIYESSQHQGADVSQGHL